MWKIAWHVELIHTQSILSLHVKFCRCELSKQCCRDLCPFWHSSWHRVFLPHLIPPNPRGHQLGFNVMSEAASSHSSKTSLSYRKSLSVRVNCGNEGEQQCLGFKTQLCWYQYHIMIILWQARSLCELGAVTFKIDYHCIYRHRTDRHGLL